MSLHKTLLAGFALTALAAGAARADDAQQPCRSTARWRGSASWPAPAVDLGQLVQHLRPGSAITAIANRTVDLPNSFCNFAGSRCRAATALLAADASPVQPGFARAVSYTSTVNNWATTPYGTRLAGGGAPGEALNGGSQPD